jgi:hypothetical protein
MSDRLHPTVFLVYHSTPYRTLSLSHYLILIAFSPLLSGLRRTPLAFPGISGAFQNLQIFDGFLSSLHFLPPRRPEIASYKLPSPTPDSPHFQALLPASTVPRSHPQPRLTCALSPVRPLHSPRATLHLELSPKHPRFRHVSTSSHSSCRSRWPGALPSTSRSPWVIPRASLLPASAISLPPNGFILTHKCCVKVIMFSLQSRHVQAALIEK